jgi:hypothetical protein
VTSVVFAKNKDVIKELSPQSAREPLGEGIHVRGTRRRADDSRAGGLEHRGELPCELRVAVANERLRCLIERRLASPLCTPRVRWSIGPGSVHNDTSAEIEDEEDETSRNRTS